MGEDTNQVVIVGSDGLSEEHLRRVLTPFPNSRRFVAMEVAAKALEDDSEELDKEIEQLAKACLT